MRRLSWTSFVISTLLLAGCAVGPNYKRPQVAVPRQWTVAAARGTSATPIEKDDWWTSFQDPELNSLVERSAKQNLDFKLALERIQEARAARGVVRSGYFPSINGASSATRNRQRIIVPALRLGRVTVTCLRKDRAVHPTPLGIVPHLTRNRQRPQESATA